MAGRVFNWARKLRREETRSPTEVLAVDGKFARASGLRTVSVWASEQQIVLAQQQVADKTDEITVIPELLEVLDLAGTTVTIDAAGTQKQIAWVIREHHANYVLALKANHKHLFADVQWLFVQHNDARIGLPAARGMDALKPEILSYSPISVFWRAFPLGVTLQL